MCLVNFCESLRVPKFQLMHNVRPFLSCKHSIYFFQGYQKSEVGITVRRCPLIMKIQFDWKMGHEM